MLHGNLDQYKVNPFEVFDKGNVVVTAGNLEERNSMAISWGTFGTLFNKKVVFIFVKESRFTKHLLDKEERFTLSFLSDKYKKQVEILGTKSGKDCDKYKLSGLTPVYDTDTTLSYLKESDCAMKIKKIASFKLSEANIFDKSIIDKFYSQDKDDYHTVYVGEINQFLVKENEI